MRVLRFSITPLGADLRPIAAEHDMADRTITTITETINGGESTPNKPFFLYLPYTPPHWPLQLFEDDIAKYRGKHKID